MLYLVNFRGTQWNMWNLYNSKEIKRFLLFVLLLIKKTISFFIFARRGVQFVISKFIH